MKVCIGITTRNRKNVVVNAIDSALVQNYPHIDIFVFDDGSTDGTFELRLRYPQIKWERSNERIGLLQARNYLMKNCQADIFVSLDDDAWFLNNNEIYMAVEHFKQNSKLAAIAFDILEPNSTRNQKSEVEPPVETNFFIGAGHALRIEAVKKAGYYIPFPMLYGHEEKDLAIRLLDLDFDIKFLPGVNVWHDVVEMSRDKYEQNLGFTINDLIFKYRRVPLLFVAPVLAKGLYRTMRGKVRKGISGVEAATLFFKFIPSQRKYVKRVRVKTYRNYLKVSRSFFAYLHNEN